MAKITLNSNIQQRYDSLENWNNKNPVLKSGEIGVCVVPADIDSGQNEPAILIKVGDGSSTWKQLSFISSLSGDIYPWAKNPTKPTYEASEISGLSAYISEAVSGKVDSSKCGDIISHNVSEFATADHNHDIANLNQASGYIIFNCGSASVNI